MTLNRQPIVRHQSAARNSRGPTLHKPGISQDLQSFTNTAFISERFPVKRDARLPDVGRRCGREVEQTKNGKVAHAEDDALRHTADFITLVGRTQP